MIDFSEADIEIRRKRVIKLSQKIQEEQSKIDKLKREINELERGNQNGKGQFRTRQ